MVTISVSDRLRRTGSDTFAPVGELLGYARVSTLEQNSESIDTTTSGGKLVFHIFAALAEFERELIRERTHAGLAAARARGRLGGRPTVMPPDKVATARQMYASKDFTVEAIARVLGVSRASIYRHLVDPTSAGDPPDGAGAAEVVPSAAPQKAAGRARRPS